MKTKSIDYLGKGVLVKIDRPLGCKHPKHNFYYPVNYGYIPGTISGDGEELDAYVLGEFKPLDEFRGQVKAIIHKQMMTMTNLLLWIRIKIIPMSR